MTQVTYVVGAGLSKALQQPGFRVPVMQDFISVAADYMEKDAARVIFSSLGLLDRCGCFEWPIFAPNDDATRAEIAEYAKALRRRPAENIEALLAAATGSERTLATKVRYLINRLFVLLGWNIDDVLLRRFLSSQFARPGSRHSIINFNYDLFTDRVVQEIEPSWSVATGYAIAIGGCVYSDPEAGPPGPDVMPIDTPTSDPNILIVKPHGSLNWLVPLKHGLPQGKSGLLFADRPPIVPLEPNGRLRYCAVTSAFQYIYPPNDDPCDVLPAIVPPVKSKDMALPLFEALQNAERKAIQTADEIYLIGWSMPSTDDNQVDLICEAVASRDEPLRRVIIVNRGEDPAYFARIANVFGVDRRTLSIFNDGFSDFVTATT